MERRSFFIASGCPIATTSLYRCVHLQEQLRLLGHDAMIEDWSDPSRIDRAHALQHALIVLYRLPSGDELRRLIGDAQRAGKPVIFDTDDLVFEPESVEAHRAVTKLTEAGRAQHTADVRRYLETLLACDAAIVASPLLAQFARRRGKRAFTFRNCIGTEMQRVAARLHEERAARAASDKIVIGYGSGTDTHDIDFVEAAPALATILARFPQAEVWIVGPLELPDELRAFAERIRRFPLADWQTWFELQSQFDIAVAPLECDNVFCRAKSAIKFLEAGILGVPLVASDIDPFRDAITHTLDGFLAADQSEWTDAIATLIGDREQRARVGEQARNTVLQLHTTQARSAEFAVILPQLLATEMRGTITSSQIPQVDFRPEFSVPLVINWLIPEPFAGAGGDFGIYRIIRYLAEFGHECHVHVIPYTFMNNYTTEQIGAHVQRHFGPTTAQYHRWSGEIAEADCTFATFWRTVEHLLPLRNTGRRYYLVQDYEPYFYPIGTHQIRAEETYRLGLHHITLGRWLTRLLREKFHAQSDYFDFAVDTNVYWPRPNLRGEQRRICFYARPPTDRRIYEIGLDALRLVHAQMPNVEIVFFGADKLTPPPDFPHVNRGLIKPEELATLFSSCDVGLVCSLTNPSFVPLEMLACRCAVVEVASERFEGILTHGKDAWLVQPNARALADGVLQLLRDDTLRAHLVENGYERARAMNWRDSARQIERVLLQHAPPEDQRCLSRRR